MEFACSLKRSKELPMNNGSVGKYASVKYESGSIPGSYMEKSMSSRESGSSYDNCGVLVGVVDVDDEVSGDVLSGEPLFRPMLISLLDVRVSKLVILVMR
jgi:hypothetical protein